MTLIGQISVRVGPAGATGIEWRDLFIKSNVELNSGPKPNQAKTEIYNLAPSSLDLLTTRQLVIQILAGTDSLDQIFYGDIARKGVETKVQHPDQITTINAADGQRIFREKYWSKSYPAGTTRTQIVSDLLAENAISRGYFSPALVEVTYPSAMAFAGMVRDILTELYWEAQWSLQKNALTVILPGETPINTVVLSPQTGLIGSPEKTDKGMKCKAVFNARLVPGMGCSLTSRLLSGLYRVTSVKHSIDTEMSSWESEIVGVKV